jgi:hypothetical protein
MKNCAIVKLNFNFNSLIYKMLEIMTFGDPVEK